MRILLALLVFSLIIVFHEFGHFLLAKLNHIVVVEFSLGFGPRLLSVKKGETRYSLKLFPLGGSCMMLGEDTGDYGEGTFGSKSVAARFSVVAAGPVFNFLMAWLLSVVILSIAGYDKPVLLGVSQDSPAMNAGIMQGDQLTSIDGKSIRLYREVLNYSSFHQARMGSGRPIRVSWLHEGEKHSAEIIPVDNGSGRYVFGFYGDSNLRFRESVPAVIVYSFYEVRYWLNTVFESLRMMFTGQVTLNEVSGPVGVVDMIGETYEESKSDGALYVFLNMLNISILLSSNLGVMNLLPFPALDGGRLLLLLCEGVTRKKINPEIEARINLTGFALLILLIIAVMINDVRKLVF